jgi:hypothetical protein
MEKNQIACRKQVTLSTRGRKFLAELTGVFRLPWQSTSRIILMAAVAMTLHQNLKAQVTELVNFDNTADLTTKFNPPLYQTPVFTNISSGGYLGSGCVNVPLGSQNVWTTKAGYSVAGAGDVYELSSYFLIAANSGYGQMGFTTAAASDGDGTGSPPISLGMAFHGGGGMFINNQSQTNVSWLPDLTIVPPTWYYFKLTVTAMGGNTYNLNFQIWNVDQSNFTLTTQKTSVNNNGMVNPTIGSAPVLHVYFSAAGNRMSKFDQFLINLMGGAVIVPPGYPVVVTNAVSGITTSSATCGGNVTSDGGSPVLVRGNCWNTSPSPTLANSHTTNGAGTGMFTSSLTPLSPSTTYWVRSYATNSTGTSYGNERSFTTFAGPAFSANASVSNNVTCYGGSNGSATVNVVGGSAPYTYSWSTTPIQTTQTATGLSAGTYSVTVTDATTATTSSSVTVTQPAQVLPVITGPALVCASSTGNVYSTQTGMSNYVWSVSSGGTITSGGTSTNNTVTVTWNSSGAGTVSVNYANASGCTAAVPTTYPVTVIALPTPTITGAASVCATSTGNIYTTQTGMTGYIWNVSAGGIITAGLGTNAITVTWNTPGANTVSVNYANSNSCVATNPTVYNVAVNALPVPTITGPAPVCVTSTGNVYTTQAGMTGYSWTVSAGGIITSGGTSASNTATVTWNTTGAQTVSVNYTNPNNCAAANPTIYNVTVNALPVPTISGPVSVCAGAISNIYTTQPGMTGYTWNVSAGGTITAGAGTNALTVTWNNAGAQTVGVNYTNGSGCAAAVPATYNVTVYPTPVPTISGLATTCSGLTQTYSTQSGMTNYVWSVSAGGTITAGGTSTSNTISVNWVTAGTQTVSVNYTNANGCTASASTVYNITVNPTPTPSISAYNTPCPDNTPVDYYTETGMNNYLWSVSPGGTILSGQGTFNIQTSWNVPGPGTVSVTYTTPTGCASLTPGTFPVFVNYLPSTAGNVSGVAEVCAGATGIAYSVATIPWATSYVWILPAGATIATGSGTNSITVNFSESATTGNISVAGNNECGNGPASPNFPVTVTSLTGAAGSISGPDEVCSPSTGNIYSVLPVTNATSYSWSIPAGATITSGANTNTITLSYNATATSGSVSVFGSNSCGSGSVSPAFAVTVFPTPSAPVISVSGDSLTSSAPLGNQWYYTQTQGGIGIPLPDATEQSLHPVMTGWYWCVVTLNGCSSTQSNILYFVMVGQQELQSNNINIYPVPNDGTFTLSISSAVVKKFNVAIYNQTGQMIKEVSDLTVMGTLEKQFDLRPVPTGIYTVVVRNDEGLIVRKILITR